MQNSTRKIMSEDEMSRYIEKIGRTELFDEMQDLNNHYYGLVRSGIPYPRYLKAICVSLVALGYDEQWVDTTFRDALEKRYPASCQEEEESLEEENFWKDNAEDSAIEPTKPGKKFFWTVENGRTVVLQLPWDDNTDNTEDFRALQKQNVYQVCLPVYIMKNLVRMTAFHENWNIIFVDLQKECKAVQNEIDDAILATFQNRGYFIRLLDAMDRVENLEQSLPGILAIIIKDNNGEGMLVCVNGIYETTSNVDPEMVNAVRETIEQSIR